MCIPSKLKLKLKIETVKAKESKNHSQYGKRLRLRHKSRTCQPRAPIACDLESHCHARTEGHCATFTFFSKQLLML